MLLRASQARRVRLSADNRIDPSAWVQLGPLDIAQVQPLGDPPAPPKVVITRSKRSAREALGGKVPKASPEAQAFLELLKKRKKPKKPSEEQPKKEQPKKRSGARGELSRLLSWLSKRTAPKPKPKPPRSSPAQEREKHRAAFLDDVQPKVPSGPSWLERLSKKLAELADKLAARPAVSQALERSQNKYLKQLMGKLEGGDLNDALRHAIPLSDLKGGSEGSSGFAFPPSPRSSLRFTAGGGAKGRSMLLPSSVFDSLKEKYRRAFEKLKEEGRFEEAAFVLAELLNKPEEAVALLETNGLHKLAAELAEAKELAPALIVRQWALAGDWVRAVRIARRWGVFSDAVMQLQSANPDRAKSLRLLWADHLAESGDFMAAVDVLWPVTEARHLAQPWILSGVELGGSTGARMMVKALSLMPEKQQAMTPLIQELLEDESLQGAFSRQSFAQALSSAGVSEALDRFAKPAVRALYRDATTHDFKAANDQVNTLLRRANDPTFRADLPAYPSASASGSLVSRSQSPLQIHVPASDVGTLAVEDLVPLEDGRLVAALGEAGVLLLSKKGARIAHLNQPAHTLIPADFGHSAIGLSPRGEHMSLCRLDLVNQRASTWCETRLRSYAKSYDGSVWFVGLEPQGALAGIDVTSPNLQALWHLDEVCALDITRSERALAVLKKAPDQQPPEAIWTYALPALTLQQQHTGRTYKPSSESVIEGCTLTSDGGLLYISRSVPPPSDGVPEADEPLHSPRWQISLVRNSQLQTSFQIEMSALAAPLRMIREGDWMVLTASEAGLATVRLISISQGRICAQVALEGAHRAHARLSLDRLTLWDDRGRLLQLGLSHGRLLSNLRLSP